jgi:hypothetical protein
MNHIEAQSMPNISEINLSADISVLKEIMAVKVSVILQSVRALED